MAQGPLPDTLAANPVENIIWHKSPFKILLENHLVAQFDGSAKFHKGGVGIAIWSFVHDRVENLTFADLAMTVSFTIPPCRAIDAELAAAELLIRCRRALACGAWRNLDLTPRLPRRSPSFSPIELKTFESGETVVS